MSKRTTMVGVLLAAWCLLPAGPAWADKPVAAGQRDVKKPAAGKFIRITRNARDQPVALETAIARYVPAAGEGGLQVDLIGAVHVGDRAYYEKLNKQFKQYDVVLYELVAPQGTRIPKGGKRDSSNPLALIQQMAKSVLDLESQTEQIDYTARNFVHADLSPEEMAAAIRKRGDDGVTLALSITADLIRQANLEQHKAKDKPAEGEPELDLLSLLLDAEGPAKLKRTLAEKFADIESPSGGLGNTLGTILIADRNQAALKVFQKELAKGRKKIAIFYGAGHLADFEKRLREDFGLKRAGEQWLTAWDLQKKSRGFADILERLDH